MQHGEDLLHIIGVGDSADWEAECGSVYYIEDKTGETALPVFTTAERADTFVQANFVTPEAHMSMLESVGAAHAAPLTEGRFIIMPVRKDGLARAAGLVGADYLIRDPRPGAEREILRLS